MNASAIARRRSHVKDSQRHRGARASAAKRCVRPRRWRSCAKHSAVVLPLVLGAFIEQTASVLGVSVGGACQLRRRFITAGRLVRRTPPIERPNAVLKRAEEVAFLAPFIERACGGRIVVVAEIRAALEARLGRRTAPSRRLQPAAPPQLAQGRA